MDNLKNNLSKLDDLYIDIQNMSSKRYSYNPQAPKQQTGISGALNWIAGGLNYISFGLLDTISFGLIPSFETQDLNFASKLQENQLKIDHTTSQLNLAIKGYNKQVNLISSNKEIINNKIIDNSQKFEKQANILLKNKIGKSLYNGTAPYVFEYKDIDQDAHIFIDNGDINTRFIFKSPENNAINDSNKTIIITHDHKKSGRGDTLNIILNQYTNSNNEFIETTGENIKSIIKNVNSELTENTSIYRKLSSELRIINEHINNASLLTKKHNRLLN